MYEGFPLALTDVLVSELDDEIIVLDVRTDRASTLNGSAAAVWQACDGTSSIETIASQVSERLSADVSADFVRLALGKLAESGLLENGEAFLTLNSGPSRLVASSEI